MSIMEEAKNVEIAEIHERCGDVWVQRLGNLDLELKTRAEKGFRLVFAKSEKIHPESKIKSLPVVGTSFLRAACKDANGFFRCRTQTVGQGCPQVIHESWFCFKTKHVKPGSTGYFWQQVNVFVTWSSEYSVTMLLCVDAPDKVRQSILNAAKMGTVDEDNPYGWHLHIMEPVLDLYNESFWGLRDKVRNEVEKKREIATHTNFHVLHDLARHLTHLEETLEVALTTLESMEAAQDVLRREICRVKVKSPQFREELEGLLRENALDMYHSRGAVKASAARAKSLSARHKNEINLAFNLVMQYESRTMKVIAIVTLLFLPGSFVASIFGMGFFDCSDERNLILAGGFWIYWVITVGLTTLTVAWWLLWQRLEGTETLKPPSKPSWRWKPLSYKSLSKDSVVDG